MPIIASEQINADEIEIAKLLAKRRYENNRLMGLKNYRNTTQKTELEKEYRSILGELCFSKMIDVYPPLSQNPKEMASAPDLMIRHFSIDVKTTDMIKNDLMVNVESFAHYRDYYVLMVFAAPYIHFMGYATYNEVKTSQIHRPKNGRPPFYRIPPGALNFDLELFQKIRNA